MRSTASSRSANVQTSAGGAARCVDDEQRRMLRPRRRRSADRIRRHVEARGSVSAASVISRPPTTSYRRCSRTAASLRMLQPRPVGDPLLGDEEQRDHVVAGQQHAIERAHGGDEILFGLGLQHRLDHGVGRRVLDTGEVIGAGRLRRRRRPAEQLLVARRQRRRPRVLDHVVVVVGQPLLILGAVDDAQLHLDAEAFDVAREATAAIPPARSTTARISNSS